MLRNEKIFGGKTAVITGGSRGIGAEIARGLAECGADIAVIYAGNTEKAEAVCRECSEKYNIKAKSYKCDVSIFSEVKGAVSEIKAEFGGIDILVNNAGINRDNIIAMMKESDFDDVIAINLKGAFNMIRNVVPLMIRKRSGAIINISSVSGIIGNAGQANYSASKAGIIGLTKAAAKELAPRGITVNAVAPGFVETDMTESMQISKEEIEKLIPLGRMAKPADIAQAVIYLAGAGYVTGEVLKVDGGIAM